MLSQLHAVALRLLTEEDGQGVTEYGLVVVLVGIVAILALQLFGGYISAAINGIAGQI